MTWVAAAVIGGGASIVSGLIGADAAKSAANQQAQAAAAAQAQQQANFERIQQQQAPYRASGYNALNLIGGMTTGATPTYDAQGNPIGTQQGTGYLQHQFSAEDLKNGLAPNYDFQLAQGQQASNAMANVGGGLIGGNAFQGMQNRTQDIAAGAYQNAFNNYQSQRTGIYNTLASIAGIGQTGQTQTNTAGTNATNAIGQLGVGAAGAQASGTLGAATAYGNAINGAGNYYALSKYLAPKSGAVTPVQSVGQPDNIIT
jgi:hypothetical protein